MGYSLLSRFQGALFGGILGDAITTQIQTPSLYPSNQQPDWYKILHYQPSKLIDNLQQICLMLNQSNQLEQQIFKCESRNSGEWAYLALPIILFYHEDFVLLQKEIRIFAQYWQWSDEVVEDVLIWSYIMVLALKKKLDKRNIIGQLLAGVRAKQTPLYQLLRQLESWLFESLTLERVVEKLSTQNQEWSIPLSLYCFSSTPENFYLSISRATHHQTQARITAILTGTLAGGYNGIIGIPTPWRNLSAENPVYQEIDRQGTTLFNNWSGVYQKGRQLDRDIIGQRAIASPGIIQPRSSLKVISQRECT
ncbi:MAG: ADP-ribosylglycohydrolase family protein [Xenococcaceae cyanobacterium MO_188.B29]|nr:ADP-ribosylglycohydrolase family protein [Xenococcaceae cyanobacterium MO_188.B29]